MHLERFQQKQKYQQLQQVMDQMKYNLAYKEQKLELRNQYHNDLNQFYINKSNMPRVQNFNIQNQMRLLKKIQQVENQV
ncbi:unnamed protein product [Paramecium primaurelia]|uniref:Uncharacterized protein n=1 Tax=Paramecium primaurelia TaxID=5886 RepID=A0A8S1LG28_PARPR|nr:unnamed protein product [Paramecium primaurelia]